MVINDWVNSIITPDVSSFTIHLSLVTTEASGPWVRVGVGFFEAFDRNVGVNLGGR